jgi:hypothetical protein
MEREQTMTDYTTSAFAETTTRMIEKKFHPRTSKMEPAYIWPELGLAFNKIVRLAAVKEGI